MGILERIGKELTTEEPWKRAILEPLQIFGVERLIFDIVIKLHMLNGN